MPYAQAHYPFENKEQFEAHFPADFIAEGLDQTRGWFYTLMVLSDGAVRQAGVPNVVVNGLVLAEDGRKMSKRLKNYPDPVYMLDTLRRRRAAAVPDQLAGGAGRGPVLLRGGREARCCGTC